MTQPANNRFTDPTPFTPLSQLSPKARDWHIEVAAAKSRFKQSNDPDELIQLGVFPADYRERQIAEADEVSQASQDVAKAIDFVRELRGA